MRLFTRMNYCFILILFIGGCASNASEVPENGQVMIYTSIYPIEYITEQLASDFADVKSVYPPGVDAHTYEPTTKDMIDVSKSDAFIYLGAGMESFADTMAEALQTSDVSFLEVGANEALFMPANTHSDHDGHDHGDVDPHIWFDPLRMVHMGELIKDDLIALFPDESELLEANFADLQEELIDLDAQYETVLATKRNKKMIVSHAAYGYWEERYGIEQIPISGISSTQEPSQKELAQVIEQANEANMDYLFFEQNTSHKIGEIIQNHIHAKALYIHNLEVRMDEDIEHGADYRSIMQANLEALDQGLE